MPRNLTSKPRTAHPPNAEDVPKLVADKLAARCWSIQREELRNEAELAAITIRKNFDPARGDLRGYLWSALARHLTNYMWDNGSPVSYKHRRAELRNTRAVEVETAAGMPSTEDPGGAVAHTQWRVRVMERTVAIAGEDAMVVVPCLFEAETPLAVARARNVPLMQVLEAISRVRELISDDQEMRNLYAEMS